MAENLRNTISWNSDGVKLEGISKVQVLTSPSFHIPADINVSMTVPVKFYSVCVMYIHAQAQLKCRIGDAEVDNRLGVQASKGLNKNKSENYTSQKNGTERQRVQWGQTVSLFFVPPAQSAEQPELQKIFSKKFIINDYLCTIMSFRFYGRDN